MKKIQKENNFIYLFAALLFYLIGAPIISGLLPESSGHIQGFIFTTTLLIAIFSCATNQHVIYAGVFLALISLASAFLAGGDGNPFWEYTSMLSFLVFLMIAIVVAGVQVFATIRPDVNQLVGAVCVYLLIGAIWSILYALLYTVDPASFSERADLAVEGASRDWVYFSFVTLTTVGYGDITPVTPMARALTFIEAIVGQFYIAILVAGLVGSYLAHRRAE